MTIDDTFRSALERLHSDLRAELDASLRRQEEDLRQRADAERAAAVEQAVAAARRDADAQAQQARGDAEVQLAQARQEHARQQDELRRSAEQQVTELRRLLDELRRTAQEQIDQARRTLEADIAEARQRAEAETEDARRLAQAQVDDVQREMQRRLETVRRDLDAARRDLEARDSQLDTLRRELEERSGELDARVRELDAARREADSARRAVDEARGAASHLDGERHRVEALADGLRTLDEAGSLGDVLDRLAQLAIDEADRSAVMLIKDAALQEWRSFGFGGGHDGPRRALFDEAGLAGTAAREARALTRRAADGGAHPPIAADPVRSVQTRDAAAWPVLVAGTPVAVLYADAPAADGDAPAWFDVVGALTRHAGLVLEAMTVRRAAGLTPIARPRGPVAEVLPFRGVQ